MNKKTGLVLFCLCGLGCFSLIKVYTIWLICYDMRHHLQAVFNNNMTFGLHPLGLALNQGETYQTGSIVSNYKTWACASC